MLPSCQPTRGECKSIGATKKFTGTSGDNIGFNVRGIGKDDVVVVTFVGLTSANGAENSLHELSFFSTKCYH